MVTVFFWIVIVLFCIVVEMHTNAFLAIFIGTGATLAFILALVGVPFAIQALAWLVFSGGTIAFLRPWAMRKFQHHRYEIDMSKPTHTTLTNLTGFVEEPVGDEKSPGRVKIQGELWRAVTDWPEALPNGTQIVVKKAYGTTLWVDPV